MRKYIEQERKDADNKEPLFIYTRYEDDKPAEKRMTPPALASIYRDAARKMGIKWENGEQNPLRPKGMRHLFRTACDTVKMAELYTNAFMGHRNTQGQDHSEIPKAILELQYLKVEPAVTVYGGLEESLEIKEDVARLELRIGELNRKIEEHKQTISLLQTNLKHIARDAVKMELRKLYGEDYEALKEAQEEFTRRIAEKAKGVSEGKVSKAKVKEVK